MRQQGTQQPGIASLTVSGIALALSFGCGGGDGAGPGVPGNNAPIITTPTLGPATEGQDINTIVTASDADGDIIEFSLTTYPAGATITPIDSTSARVNWTPTHAQADQPYNITVQADDGLDATQRVFSDSTANVSTASGILNEMGSGASPFALDGIDVQIGSQSTTTDSGGYWQISNIPDGSHAVTFNDPLNTYETHKAGTLIASKANEDAARITNLEHRLFLQADRQFIKDTIRYNGEIRKWKQKPIVDIYKREFSTNVAVNVALVNGVRDVIKNELSQFCAGTFTFTDADINEYDSKPAGLPANGHITIYWNDSIGGLGANNSYFSGNEVTSAYSVFKTSIGKPVWMQELVENMIGSGETNDVAYSDSCLYDSGSGPTATSFSADDIKLSEAVYSINARPAGNKDFNSTDRNDENSSGTLVQNP